MVVAICDAAMVVSERGDRATMRSAAMEVKNTAGDALRQAFMAREDYEGLREEERVWARLQKPLGMVAVTVVWTGVVAAMMVMVDVVFAVSGDDFPFCQKRHLPSYDAPGHRAGLPSYLYTEEEAVDAFWLVVFLPSSIVFVFSTIYLFAGISVAYVAPERHGCLKVVENDCCASSRGGVRCLSTLNLSFMVTYVLLSIFLGIFTLRLGTSCSVALFWCYEVACWGLVVLLGATAFLLQRKAAVIMDAGAYYGHHERGVELLEAIAITPEMEGRVAAGFKSWMGPADALLSDDEESAGGHHDGLDDVWEGDATEYLEAPEHLSKSMIG